MTKSVLRKLEDAFADGLSDAQACVYAGIGESTLYDYLKQNPQFSEQRERLKQHPTIAAKRAVAKAINKGDLATARWWLERRAKSEFSNRVEVSELEQQQIVMTVSDFGSGDLFDVICSCEREWGTVCQHQLEMLSEKKEKGYSVEEAVQKLKKNMNENEHENQNQAVLKN